MPAHQRHLVLVALLFVVPFNVMLFAIENGLFLLFPTRSFGAAAGDLGHVGRHIVFFIVKILAVTVACGLAAGLGTLAALLAGGSIAVGVAVALLTLTVTAVATVPGVGWAYHRFDPSADTPA